MVPDGRPRCPQWFTKDARRIWKKVLRTMDALRLQSPAYGTSLEIFVDTLAEWKKCRRFVLENNPRVPIYGPDGELAGYKLIPEITRGDRLAALAMKMAREFGLTPSAISAIVSFDNHRGDSASEEKKKRFVNLGN